MAGANYTLLQNASFMLSAMELGHCPADVGREVAFCGRSNAGKSTALNALTNRTALARVSKTPGRTRAINFFALGAEQNQRLVDLPGYGYARVSREERRTWTRNIDAYLRNRSSLVGLVLIVDIRRLPVAFDMQVLQWCQEVNIPALLLLAKADKLPYAQRMKALRACEETCANLCQVLAFSAHAKIGVEDARTVAQNWLQPG